MISGRFRSVSSLNRPGLAANLPDSDFQRHGGTGYDLESGHLGHIGRLGRASGSGHGCCGQLAGQHSFGGCAVPAPSGWNLPRPVRFAGCGRTWASMSGATIIPPISGPLFFRERPTVASVVRNTPFAVLSSMHASNQRPLQFGWRGLVYELEPMRRLNRRGSESRRVLSFGLLASLGGQDNLTFPTVTVHRNGTWCRVTLRANSVGRLSLRAGRRIPPMSIRTESSLRRSNRATRMWRESLPIMRTG